MAEDEHVSDAPSEIEPPPVLARDKESEEIKPSCPANYQYGCNTRPVAVFKNAGPYVFSSMVAWPVFWLWRGLDWKNKQAADVLLFYIKSTYLQAKVIQIGLIGLGIFASLDLARFKRKPKAKTHEDPANAALRA